MSTALIEPLPWKYVRSAVAISSMSEDERAKMLEWKRNLITKYLDDTKTWTSQAPEQREKAIEEARKELPFLARYVDAWPMEGLLRSDLSVSASLHRRGKPKRQSGKRKNDRSADPALRNRTDRTTRTNKRVHRNSDQAHASSSKRARLVADFEQEEGEEEDSGESEIDELAFDEHSELTPLGTDEPGRESSHAGQADERAASSSSHTLVEVENPEIPSAENNQGGQPDPQVEAVAHNQEKPAIILPQEPSDPSDTVREFLRHLRPSMEKLMPKFLEGGIVDQDCLDGLAAMPDEELLEYLKADLQLNAFQVRIIRIALRNVKQNAD